MGEDYCGDAGLVECLLDELNGVDRSDIIRTPWRHPAAEAVEDLGQSGSRTEMLCERLRAVDVTKYSLELQMWWRDHKKRDEARVRRQIKEATRLGDSEREYAFRRLSNYERWLVGAVYVRGLPATQPGRWEMEDRQCPT